jgi:predicted DNA-binding protein with PD1-like motif
MKTLIFRLRPGADLKTSIERVVQQHNVQAGFIVTCVAGLKNAVVRMAGAKPDAQDIRTFSGDFEVVSLVGTVSVNGVSLHMSFANTEGQVVGGHLTEGCIVHPTAEIVIGFVENLKFTREYDEQTGFPELTIGSA